MLPQSRSWPLGIWPGIEAESQAKGQQARARATCGREAGSPGAPGLLSAPQHSLPIPVTGPWHLPVSVTKSFSFPETQGLL